MACSTLPGGVLYSSSRSTRSAWVQRRPGEAAPISSTRLVVKAVAAPEDCNEEDCAPEKEVGKVSMEWKAAENTKVLGTYPPTNKPKWTGYVEKDTAGQTNIYAVEPTVYVSENAISSNTAGDSSEGSEQTVSVALGLALGLLAGAFLVLQLGGNSSEQQQQPPADGGPTLTYYIQKFTPPVPETPVSTEQISASTSSSSLVTPAAEDSPIPSAPAAE
eukprot:c13612_g1_i1 orf=246-899(+)